VTTMRCRWQTPVLVCACIALLLALGDRPRALSDGIVISQVFSAGGTSGAPYKNDFVELFNRGRVPVSLGGMSLQYATATGTGLFGSNVMMVLSGTLQPGQYYLLQLGGGAVGAALPRPDASGSAAIPPTGAKVALVNSAAGLMCNGASTACTPAQKALIVDVVGWGGANFSEAAAAPATGNTTAVVRNDSGCAETDSNLADFLVAAPAPRNMSSPRHPCGAVQTPPSGTGSAAPTELLPLESVLLTVVVTPGDIPASTGLTVAADLSAIGGAAAQSFRYVGTNPDATQTFTWQATVAAATAPGPKTLPVTIADAQNRTAATTIALTVREIVPIHAIQGSGSESPVTGRRLTTTGIVTAQRNDSRRGFFIEATEAESDEDALTSEGLFVSMGAGAELPPVGARVQVTGTVAEDHYLTELTESPTVVVRSTGQALPGPVMIAESSEAIDDPAVREQYEGMRVVFAQLTVVAPTGGTVQEDSASATSDGVFTAVMSVMPRPFREPGIEKGVPPPTGAPAGIPEFDGNPERWLVDSGALSGTPLDVPAGTLIGNAVGPLSDADEGHVLLLDLQAAAFSYPTGAAPIPPALATEFTIAGFNLGRFYDATDDPGSDIVLTSEAFAKRLNKASLAIRGVLLMPDILGVVEVEDLKTLEALAAKVNADAGAAGQPNPGYGALLIEGNDPGLIDVGFLVKQAPVGTAPRVSVLALEQIGSGATYVNADTGATEPLNDRPSLALKARVADPRGGSGYALTVIVNHLQSLEGIETEQHVRDRRARQAEQLAGEIQRRQTAGERVVLVGDFGAFQFSDGYVDVMGTLTGRPTSDPVVLSTADVVNPDLVNLLTLAPPDQQYTCVVDGSAQQVDHVLVTSDLFPRVARYAVARLGADFPLALYADGTRPEGLSGHDAPVAYFSFPTSDVKVSQLQAPNPVTSGSVITYTVVVENGSRDPAYGLWLRDLLPAGATLVSYAAPDDWLCPPVSGGLRCEAQAMAGQSTASFTIVAQVPCGTPNGVELANLVEVGSGMFDPDPANNSSTLLATVGNPPPVISGILASPAALWPANNRMVRVTIGYAAQDNCDPAPVCTLSVRSNERIHRHWGRRISPDWQVVDAHTLWLRAELSRLVHGRAYTVTVACTDRAGGTASQVVAVKVAKNPPPRSVRLPPEPRHRKGPARDRGGKQ
jgi:uncharacterized protein